MKNLKKLIITVLLNLFTISIASAQWETIRFFYDSTPLPWINSVSFYDANNGLAACEQIAYYVPSDPISDIGCIIKTSDGGITWETVLAIDSISFLDVLHVNQNTAFCVGLNSQRTEGIIARSTDSGYSWDTTMIPLPILDISFPSTNIGYACGFDGAILKTTDGGVNWDFLNSGLTNTFGNCKFVNDTIGFITSDTTIWKTIDGGINWDSQNFSIGYGIRHIVEVSFPSFDTGYFMISSDSCYVYKTTNSGNQWYHVSTVDTHQFYVSDMDFPTDSTGYFCGQFQMYKTSDGGLNWQRQHSSPPGCLNFCDDLIDVFFLDQETGFAGGNSQFYKTFNGGDSISEIKNIITDNKKISVYPNPFITQTTLESGTLLNKASLTIYNSFGHKVKQETNISGQTVTFFRDNLPSGIYFFRMEDGNEIYHGKFIISNY